GVGVRVGDVIAFHGPGGERARGRARGGNGRALGPGCRPHGRSGARDVPGETENRDLCLRPDRPGRARSYGNGSRRPPAGGRRGAGATRPGRREAGGGGPATGPATRQPEVRGTAGGGQGAGEDGRAGGGRGAGRDEERRTRGHPAV